MKSSLDRLAQEAINSALAQNWKEAELLNKNIIKQDPNHIDAHLSLGFALLQQGKFDGAKIAYRKGLKLDPGNTIARNNLDKIKVLEKKGSIQQEEPQGELLFDPATFITVAGKTKNIALINIGQADTIAHLKVGTRVEMTIKKRRVEVRTKNNDYIGTLPDDFSKRLMFFLSADSIYSVYITRVSKSVVEVFIKEEKKGRRVEHYISFPKNIRDDLKTLMGQSDSDKKKKEEYEEDNGPVSSPFDLEELESDLEEEKESYLELLEEGERDESEFEE